METLVLGVVAYEPKVVTIWDGFKKWFDEQGFAFDYVLYSNYERQVAALLAGHIQVAWNSPLAWLQTEKAADGLGRRARAIAMRDTDCDLTSVIVVRGESDARSVEDLRGRRIGVGAEDSPQATLIPLLHLAECGLEPHEDFAVHSFDVLAGKHGDHIGGERVAARALMAGDVDAACMIKGNYEAFTSDGTLSATGTRVIAETPVFDHCNFTVLDDAPAALIEDFRERLLAMRHDDPQVRHLLELEGLEVWRPGRTANYAVLSRAVTRFGTIDAFVSRLGGRCD